MGTTGDATKPLLPFLLPWTDEHGYNLSPVEILRTRYFTLSFIVVSWAFFLGLGPGNSWNCTTTMGQQISCAAALWPGHLVSAPHQFLISLFTAPWFHNGYQHIYFVTITFMLIVQAFEVRNSSRATVVIFFSTVVFSGILAGISMNLGAYFRPDDVFFTDAIERNWIGGSAGMMGVIGAVSQNTRKKWILPLVLLCFEFWNSKYNGISGWVTIFHLSSALFGFVVWGWWLNRQLSTPPVGDGVDE
jgi:hypothetical protein